MPFDATCPGCGYTATIPEEFRGKSGKCRKCGERITLGEAYPPRAESRVIEISTPAPPPIPEEESIAAPPAVPSYAPPVQTVAAPPGELPAVATSLCPFCAEPIAAAAKKCKHCGEYLDPVLRMSTEGRGGTPSIVINNSSSASSSATAVAAAGVIAGGRRWNPLVALALSVVLPGAGQLYKGKVLNAILWFIGVLGCYGANMKAGFVAHGLCVFGATFGDPDS